MTAAHCIAERVKVEIFLGAINRYESGDGAFIKKITVTRPRSIIPHPDYNAYLIINDAGLVELPEDAPIEHSYIGTISLPSGADRTRSLTGLTGTASGFGKTSDNSGASAFLNYANLLIVDNAVSKKSEGYHSKLQI